MSGLNLTYSSDIFEVGDITQAKAIILTTQAGMSPEQRWVTETPYLVRLATENFKITPKSLVLDYGCGIGRMSKALIDATGCFVVGCDISQSMRTLASDYVRSPRFAAVSPDMLGRVSLECDLVISIWVLQHVFSLKSDIGAIAHSLKGGGGLFVVNTKQRFVPTAQGGWMNDSKDVDSLLKREFDHQTHGILDASVVSEQVARQTFWAAYRKAGSKSGR